MKPKGDGSLRPPPVDATSCVVVEEEARDGAGRRAVGNADIEDRRLRPHRRPAPRPARLAAIRVRSPSCGRRRRAVIALALRHRRWQRQARRCRAPPPASCPPCRRRRSRHRRRGPAERARFSSWVHLLAGAAPVQERATLCPPASTNRHACGRGIHAPCSDRRFPHHDRVIRMSAGRFTSDSSTQKWLHAHSSPVRTFLFCPASAWPAAGDRHSRGGDVDGSAGIPDVSSVHRLNSLLQGVAPRAGATFAVLRRRAADDAAPMLTRFLVRKPPNGRNTRWPRARRISARRRRLAAAALPSAGRMIDATNSCCQWRDRVKGCS